MAEFLAVIGGISASLQLMQAAAETLLATMRLLQNFYRVPRKLATVLKDIDSSTRGLSHFCVVVLHPGCKIFPQLSNAQLGRLSSAAAAVVSAMTEIETLLTPLVGNVSMGDASHSRYPKHTTSTIRRFLNSALFMSIEDDICEKMDRLGRLNLEILRELSVVGLEIQASTSALVTSLSMEIRALNTTLAQTHANSATLMTGTRINHGPVDNRSQIAHGQSQKTSQGNALLVTLDLLRRRLSRLQEGPLMFESPLRDRVSGRSQAISLEYVLFSIRTLYTPGNFTFSPATIRSEFWQDTSNGIYLVKISEREKGHALIQKSRTQEKVRGIFINAATVSLIEILSTLSPTNTTICPRIREECLRYLSTLAFQQLGPQHPAIKIIQQLRADDGGKDLSLQALLAIVDRLQATLGPFHDLSLFALNRLVALLRRDQDFTEALRVCQDATMTIMESLGPDSLQERRIRRHMEHVYMDQGDWSAALDACFNIVGQQQVDNGTPDPRLHDECAVYTMEDIAKIYECTDRLDYSIAWMKQAVLSGGMIWSPGYKLEHVQDKLNELLHRCGRFDEARLWKSSLLTATDSAPE